MSSSRSPRSSAGRIRSASISRRYRTRTRKSLVFDDTILFDIDKFSGYDRIETGTRANVGLRYTAQFAIGAYARAVFGESYQLAGQNNFDDNTGLGYQVLRLCERPLFASRAATSPSSGRRASTKIRST